MSASAEDERICSLGRISNCRVPWPRFARQSRSTQRMHRRMPDWRAPFAPRRCCATAPHCEAFAEAKALALRAVAHRQRVRRCACGARNGSVPQRMGLARRPSEVLRRALTIDPAHTRSTGAIRRVDRGPGQARRGSPVQAAGAGAQPTIAVASRANRAGRTGISGNTTRRSVWARRALDLDPKHLLAVGLVRGVHWKRGDVEGFLEENLRRATLFGVPNEVLAHLNQIRRRDADGVCECGPLRVATVHGRHAGGPRLEFDTMLKLANRQAALYGDAGRFGRSV